MNSFKTRRLNIPAETKYLTKIRDFANKNGNKFGFNLRQLNGIKLSLDEICTNIIRYAYKTMGKPGDIQIEIAKRADKVVTTITDWGTEFDYNNVLAPDIDRYIKERKKGGFGIYLVKQLNDEVQYRREGSQNIITLINSVEPRPTLFELIKRNFKPSKMALRVRFGIVASLVITLLAIGTFFLIDLSQKRTLTKQYTNSYITILKNFASTSADYILNERELLIAEQVYDLVHEQGGIVKLTLIDRNGVIIADKILKNIGKIYNPPAGTIPLIDQEYLVQEYNDEEYGICLYYSVPIKIADAFIGKAFLAIRKDEIENSVSLNLNRVKISMYMVLFWVIGIVGISLMGNMFITPIKQITEELNRVGKEGISGGFHFYGVGEFAEISTAFNRMMKELKQSEIKLTDQARLKREMQLAQSIQQTLLPKRVPDTEGFEISARYDAAMEVGGDYYDFFYVDENSQGIAVGDVSGKGIGGAFLMSIVRTALRLEAREQGNAGEVLVRLNNTLSGEFKKGMYITLYYIILDSKRREINFASAGHTPMILYRVETDQIYMLNPKGFPIGLNLGDIKIFKKNIENDRISLKRDDLLLIYTDGITESMNPDREEFGQKRLVDFIKKYHTLSTDEFSEKLMEEVHNFTRGQPQSDDITYIAIKEKEKYSELEYHKRIELFDLIENQRYSIKDACEKVGVAKSTYYLLKRLREEMGEEALLPQKKRKEIKFLDFEISQKIIEVIMEHPEYSAKKIHEALKGDEFGPLDVEITQINRELRRLKLSNRAKRKAYVLRNRERQQKEKTL